jgi:hypothetical protein
MRQGPNRECGDSSVAIVALVLWVITAAAGVSLLGTGGAARRRAADQAAAAAAAESEFAPAEVTPAAAEGVRMGIIPARSAAVPLTSEGKPPPGPKVKVAAPPGEHPLLEFSHPALAFAGLACWFMFVFVRYPPFAWISFCILMVAIAMGLTWMIHNVRAARHHVERAWNFPPRLVLLHGSAAAIAITLSVLTALSASHA